MVQEFQVLRCFACQMFQVQQVKNSKKWNCKLCEEKQAILKVYGQGSGADCRCHVQKLNHLQGEALQETDTGFGLKGKEEISENVPDEQTQAGTADSQYRGQFVSRWNKYLVENPKNDYVEPQNEEESSNFTDTEIFSQQRELSLKCRSVSCHFKRIQKDTPSHDYEFQDSKHFKRLCSRDSRGEAKKFKICENGDMFTCMEKVYSPSKNNKVTLSSQCHENKQLSFLPALAMSRYTKSKCDKFLSILNTEDMEKRCKSIPLNQPENDTFMAVPLKKECSREEGDEAAEAQAMCSKTALTLPVCKSSSTSGLFIQNENPSRGNMYIIPEYVLNDQVIPHPNLSVNGCTVPTNVSTTIPHTTFFQTDEDFDDYY